jgi:hypothetical protein
VGRTRRGGRVLPSQKRPCATNPSIDTSNEGPFERPSSRLRRTLARLASPASLDPSRPVKKTRKGPSDGPSSRAISSDPPRKHTSLAECPERPGFRASHGQPVEDRPRAFSRSVSRDHLESRDEQKTVEKQSGSAAPNDTSSSVPVLSDGAPSERTVQTQATRAVQSPPRRAALEGPRSQGPSSRQFSGPVKKGPVLSVGLQTVSTKT